MNSPETLPAQGSPFLGTLLVRGLMLFILIGSISLVWWSVEGLLKVNQQIKQISDEATILGNEVQQLELALDPEEMAQAEVRYQAAKESLAAGPAVVGAWNDLLQETALGMSLRATVQPREGQTNVGLISWPATIELQPLLEGPQTNIPYRNLMFFTGLLENPNWRIDLIELHVVGNSNSVHLATASVQLWAPIGKP